MPDLSEFDIPQLAEAVDKWAVYAWYGLGTYILVVDVGLGLSGHKYMTEAWHEWLDNPKHKWIVIAGWAFTTKHLFFKNVLPQIDPFGAIALAVGILKKLGE